MKPNVAKDYLTQALFQLLSKKEFSEISISDLVKEAGVCRASFYRNYLTMEQIVDEYLKSIFETVPDRYTMDSRNMEESISTIFAGFETERERLSVLSKRNLLYKLPDYVYASTLKQIMKFQVFNNRYQPYFFAGAASAMIKAWIDHDMEESPEEMANLYVRSLGGYMNFQ